MSSASSVPPAAVRRRWPAAPVMGILVLVLTLVLALTWAKWQPYGYKLADLWDSGTWAGSAIIDEAGAAGASPSLSGGWTFTLTYFEAVWVALVAALVISAAVDALIPGGQLRAWLGRRSHTGGALAGGLMSMPCMMCTCCTAPIAKTLRRQGASTSSTVAYWLGNPAINPAVLAFLIIVAPWQWVVTRAVAGVVLVFGVSALVGRLVGGRRPAATHPDDTAGVHPAPPGPSPQAGTDGLRTAPRRFLRSLGRLSVTLVPEYLAVVFAVGIFRGWIFPLDGGTAQWGMLAVLIAAVLGTLVVIPTAGEIPIMLGLAAAGVGAAPLGALLITLPAISLPSMLMVGRALSWRVTVAAAGGVVLTGLGAAGMLAAIS